MSAGAAFLGGASQRLLPRAIPLRYFGSAVGFHALAWMALAAAAADWLDFRGGPGWPLAVLHLLTLGVFGMCAMGAGAQLLPVATRQPAAAPRWLAALWWAYTPAVLAIAAGMGFARPDWIAAGGGVAAACLAGWGVLMAHHLLHARGMGAVRVHAWGALACLLLLLATGLLLAVGWLGHTTPDRAVLVTLHVLFGPFGFLGLLVLGLSYVLVPMFALSDVPSPRGQLASAALAIGALTLGSCAALGVGGRAAWVLALAAALAAVVVHVHLMRVTLRMGMRRNLGRSIALVKIGWGGLVASLAFGAAVVFEAPLPRATGWLGLALAGGWLLSVLLGVLQRILPFLGAMHAPPAGRRTPTPAALTHEPSLRLHFRCHCAALAGLALALALDSALVALLAAGIGVAGALAFASFYLRLLHGMRPREV